MGSNGTRARSVLRSRWALVLVGLAAGVLLVTTGGAATAAPLVMSLTAPGAATSVRVTFTDDVYSTALTSGDLVLGDFTISNLIGTAPTITGVTKVSQKVWDLALSADASPHNTSIATKVNEIYEAGGTTVTVQSASVPFSTGRIGQMITSLTGIPLDLSTFYVAPMVGTFLQNKVGPMTVPHGITEFIAGLSTLQADTEAS